MRTTLNLSDDLLTRAKMEAARSKRTLTAVIEDALRAALAAAETGPAEPYRVRPFQGAGLQAGVDLSDSAGLLELMDDQR